LPNFYLVKVFSKNLFFPKKSNFYSGKIGFFFQKNRLFPNLFCKNRILAKKLFFPNLFWEKIGFFVNFYLGKIGFFLKKTDFFPKNRLFPNLFWEKIGFFVKFLFSEKIRFFAKLKKKRKIIKQSFLTTPS
jgi:hypothetical protein